MKVIKRITMVITKSIEGEFFEKKISFDSFAKFEEYLTSHLDTKYFKVQLWVVDEPSAQGDLF